MFITQDEFKTIKLYELDNLTYKRIESALIAAVGEAIAKAVLTRSLEKPLREVSQLNAVDIDIMSMLTIL